MRMDVSNLPPEIVTRMAANVRSDAERMLHAAMERQKGIAAFHHRNPARTAAGMRKHMALDSTLDRFLRMAHGNDVYRDSDRIKWLKRRHPEIAVECGNEGNTVVGYQPVLAHGQQEYEVRIGGKVVRWMKVYR